jgi:hypothetical protein
LWFIVLILGLLPAIAIARLPSEFSIPTWTAPRSWSAGSGPIPLSAGGGSGDPRVRGSRMPGSACPSAREARRARGYCSTPPTARNWFRLPPRESHYRVDRKLVGSMVIIQEFRVDRRPPQMSAVPWTPNALTARSAPGMGGPTSR